MSELLQGYCLWYSGRKTCPEIGQQWRNKKDDVLVLKTLEDAKKINITSLGQWKYICRVEGAADCIEQSSIYFITQAHNLYIKEIITTEQNSCSIDASKQVAEVVVKKNKFHTIIADGILKYKML